MRQLNLCGVPYTVELVDRLTDPSGRPCLGLTYLDDCHIKIASWPSPYKRWRIALHEFVHAIKCEGDISDQETLDEESLCNLVSNGLASITPSEFNELYLYITGEPDAD